MWEIINEISRRGIMNSKEISDYSIYRLGRRKKSAGGCMKQAVSRGYVRIIDTKKEGGKSINTYEVVD